MPPEGQELEARVHQRLLGEVLEGKGDRVVEVARAVGREAPLLTGSERGGVADRVVARIRGLGALEPLLADPEVSEVMANGPGRVWIERAGHLQATAIVLDRPTIEHLVERIVAPLGLRADRTAPLVDARLPDGSRVNVALPPLAVDGPYLTIRRFRSRRITLAEACPHGVDALLDRAVRDRANVVVAGGSGAGKTTLLNALAGRCPPGERIVTVEDVAELALPGEHVVRLEARPANAERVGAVTIRDLVRNALRMRPDRLVVGEVRGAESLDLLQAMNTGHAGSMATCHANSPIDALDRLATLALMADVALPLAAVAAQYRSAVDLVVQVARHPSGRR
ncbi:MAG: ATPase, T2SS/T4P/T4SS family, partial [Acidimicrobiales bacterium]